jgi:hypothetical protein
MILKSVIKALTFGDSSLLPRNRDAEAELAREPLQWSVGLENHLEFLGRKVEYALHFSFMT